MGWILLEDKVIYSLTLNEHMRGEPINAFQKHQIEETEGATPSAEQ